jgi:signal transduction histidine kinase
VLGFADLLHNFFDQVDESQVREYIDSIYSEGKHLEKLLTGMLRLFSIDSGSENWEWCKLSIDNILGSTLLSHENRIDAQQLDLDVELPNDLMNVRGDKEKLELLFDALIDNAIKFNRKGGKISIIGGNLTLHGEPLVYLRFVNDGQAVQKEDAENIFQGYSQLGDLNVGKPGGVGIGLATCRAILRQMNGEIFLEPNEDGAEGTAIALLMPTREVELKNG